MKDMNTQTRQRFFRLLRAAMVVLYLAGGAAKAQFAIGLRPSLSTYGGFDDRRRAEVSMITGTIGEKSRIEADFGWGHRTVMVPYVTTTTTGVTTTYVDARQFWGSATAIWQWSHKVFWKLYYYAGFGASAYFTEETLDILGLDVQIGLELKLRIPLQITVDYRPMLDVLDGMAYYHTAALGVRYQFRLPEPEPEPTLINKLKTRWGLK